MVHYNIQIFHLGMRWAGEGKQSDDGKSLRSHSEPRAVGAWGEAGQLLTAASPLHWTLATRWQVWIGGWMLWPNL